MGDFQLGTQEVGECSSHVSVRCRILQIGYVPLLPGVSRAFGFKSVLLVRMELLWSSRYWREGSFPQ